MASAESVGSTYCELAQSIRNLVRSLEDMGYISRLNVGGALPRSLVHEWNLKLANSLAPIAASAEYPEWHKPMQGG
jgi:hypothetical protein